MLFVPTFGENLKLLRLKVGISQEALAAAAGLKRNNSISDWEKRETPPRPSSVEKLARALGVSKSVLLDGVPTGYEDEKPLTLTSPVLSAEDAAAAAEGAVPVSEAKQRHINVIRGLRDEVFARIELELEQVVGRALAGGHSVAEPRRASRTAAQR